MTQDEMELVKQFRSELPVPDEEARRRAYFHATQPRRTWQSRSIGLLRHGSSIPRRRIAVSVGIAAAAAVAGVVSVFAINQSGSSQAGLTPVTTVSQLMGTGSPITIEHPLGVGSKQIPLADATSTLGALVTLPNSSLVKPSDAGPVWTGSLREASSGDTERSVAVTFPAQSLIILYKRPAIVDPLSNYQSYVQDTPGAEVIDLNGVPALAQNGSSWDWVEFQAGGNIIVVMGHKDEATLRGVAQSILDRSGS